MNVRSTDHARLAELLGVPAAAVSTALRELAAERAANPDRHTAAMVAEVEQLVGIKLADRKWHKNDDRAVAYYLLHRWDVQARALGAFIGRDHSGISAMLERFRERLLVSAELRARVAWLNSQLERNATHARSTA